MTDISDTERVTEPTPAPNFKKFPALPWLISCVAVLAVAAMGAFVLLGGNDAPSKEASHSDAVAKSSRVATPEQYASLVAQNDMTGDLEEWQQNCLLSAYEPMCRAKAIGLGDSAPFLADALQSATDSIGRPPAELATLVHGTINDANAVSGTAAEWQLCVEANPGLYSNQCVKEWTSLGTAIYGLSSSLDGWSPYM